MSEIISIWGKNGSGKSTIATNLACALAAKGFSVAVIGACRQFGSIQRFFGASVPQDKSLRRLLAGCEDARFSHCFVECAGTKGVSVASLADDDDCAGCSKPRPDSALTLLRIAKSSFDYTVVDCEDSSEDALSMLSLTEASAIAFVTKLSVQGAAFAKSCESLVGGLRIAGRMTVAINACVAHAEADVSSYRLFGIDGKAIRLPYCKEVERSACEGRPFALSSAISGPARQYRAALGELLMAVAGSAFPQKRPRASFAQKRQAAAASAFSSAGAWGQAHAAEPSATRA